MKLTFISDTHNLHRQVYTGKGDVLIHCGDYSNLGHIDKTMEFFDWMRNQHFKYKIVVPGNHDLSAQAGHKFHHVFEALTEDEKDINFLIDDSIEIEGIKFYGSPWSLKFYDWAFMAEEVELEYVWNQIPNDTDVLITHGPAYGILDSNRRNVHCGSKTLLERVKQVKPAVHAFGHIHEANGISLKIKPIVSINAALCNKKTQIEYKPISIEI